MVHILVIDDNPTDRLLVKRELERQFSQLQITEISDNTLLGEALNRGGFHLVITDYQLRWTNGIDVLKTFKSRYPECPIIMFTNTGNEEIAVEAMKAGLEDYIIKSPKHYVRLRVAVRGVLDRVAAWERVARLENQLHSLLERLNVGVFRASSQGQLLESNQAFLRLFDASNLADVQDIYLQQLFVQPLDSGESRSQNIEITFPLADGRVKWIRFTQYLYSAEGESTIDGLVEDITELKQAELALREFNETLEERVRERTAELEEVNAQLESFTYSVSHDLRAPLRGISFFAEMLLQDRTSELDSTAQDYLYRINDAATLMNTLIENLLEYSRLSKANLPLKAVSLNLIVDRSIAQLEAEIAQKKARITVVEPLPAVWAHPPTLLQVLANLLSNALKFMQPGIAPQVRVYAEAEEEYIYLWVEDNGIGIAEKFHDRIFGLFDRLHGQEVYPGTGIGLAIANKGVDRMGGAIGLESTLGIGTRFWVKLRKCDC
ncbi:MULTISPECIES: ATP-binding protein [unclassified Microcoleus]|uniref:ATP-binding protein n=1 Tax=unclassified Microcoleus TaxID=2642155 RepID=UPI002FD66BCA